MRLINCLSASASFDVTSSPNALEKLAEVDARAFFLSARWFFPALLKPNSKHFPSVTQTPKPVSIFAHLLFASAAAWLFGLEECAFLIVVVAARSLRSTFSIHIQKYKVRGSRQRTSCDGGFTANLPISPAVANSCTFRVPKKDQPDEDKGEPRIALRNPSFAIIITCDS